jgi:GNAT superfamily N-acetyltransferase
MNTTIAITEMPAISGLTFRRFRGEADFAVIARIISASFEADHIKRTLSLEGITNNYRHLENCNPETDMLFVEVDGQPVGYGRVWWSEQVDGTRFYEPIGYLLPEWRGKGLGTAMLTAAETRLREIAAEHPNVVTKFFQTGAEDSEKERNALLQKFGYQPVRYETNMVRDLSEPFPEAELPEGLEVRPVTPDQWRLIHDVSNEAFRDHWGARDESEEEYQRSLTDPIFHPELWMVAWEGDQIASVIHNFINEEENAEFKRRRGYTEGILTRRQWRKRGIARALLVRSMKMFKDMGMTETALSVDSQNLSGAFRLYEGVGYRKVNQQILYRKPIV